MRAESYLESWQVSNFQSMGEAIMLSLRDRQAGFTQEHFIEEARRFDMPPAVIHNLTHRLFRQFRDAGYIRLTNEMKIGKDGYTVFTVWRGLS